MSQLAREKDAWKATLEKQASIQLTVILRLTMTLFHKLLYNKTHVLRTYKPERPEIVYSLRSRKHSKSLIDKASNLNYRHFLIRTLYKDYYWPNFNFIHMLCFFAWAINFITVLFILCHTSCMWQLLSKNFYDNDDLDMDWLSSTQQRKRPFKTKKTTSNNIVYRWTRSYERHAPVRLWYHC